MENLMRMKQDLEADITFVNLHNQYQWKQGRHQSLQYSSGAQFSPEINQIFLDENEKFNTTPAQFLFRFTCCAQLKWEIRNIGKKGFCKSLQELKGYIRIRNGVMFDKRLLGAQNQPIFQFAQSQPIESDRRFLPGGLQFAREAAQLQQSQKFSQNTKYKRNNRSFEDESLPQNLNKHPSQLGEYLNRRQIGQEFIYFKFPCYFGIQYLQAILQKCGLSKQLSDSKISNEQVYKNYCVIQTELASIPMFLPQNQNLQKALNFLYNYQQENQDYGKLNHIEAQNSESSLVIFKTIDCRKSANLLKKPEDMIKKMLQLPKLNSQVSKGYRRQYLSLSHLKKITKLKDLQKNKKKKKKNFLETMEWKLLREFLIVYARQSPCTYLYCHLMEKRQAYYKIVEVPLYSKAKVYQIQYLNQKSQLQHAINKLKLSIKLNCKSQFFKRSFQDSHQSSYSEKQKRKIVNEICYFECFMISKSVQQVKGLKGFKIIANPFKFSLMLENLPRQTSHKTQFPFVDKKLFQQNPEKFVDLCLLDVIKQRLVYQFFKYEKQIAQKAKQQIHLSHLQRQLQLIWLKNKKDNLRIATYNFIPLKYEKSIKTMIFAFQIPEKIHMQLVEQKLLNKKYVEENIPLTNFLKSHPILKKDIIPDTEASLDIQDQLQNVSININQDKVDIKVKEDSENSTRILPKVGEGSTGIDQEDKQFVSIFERTKNEENSMEQFSIQPSVILPDKISHYQMKSYNFSRQVLKKEQILLEEKSESFSLDGRSEKGLTSEKGDQSIPSEEISDFKFESSEESHRIIQLQGEFAKKADDSQEIQASSFNEQQNSEINNIQETSLNQQDSQSQNKSQSFEYQSQSKSLSFEYDQNS